MHADQPKDHTSRQCSTRVHVHTSVAVTTSKQISEPPRISTHLHRYNAIQNMNANLSLISAHAHRYVAYFCICHAPVSCKKACAQGNLWYIKSPKICTGLFRCIHQQLLLYGSMAVPMHSFVQIYLYTQACLCLDTMTY